MVVTMMIGGQRWPDGNDAHYERKRDRSRDLTDFG
jgi:hypothetical protein